MGNLSSNTLDLYIPLQFYQKILRTFQIPYLKLLWMSLTNLELWILSTNIQPLESQQINQSLTIELKNAKFKDFIVL